MSRPSPEPAAPSQRCDIWLFRARLFKSRAGAGKFIEGGKVRVERGGQVMRLKKASAAVRPGDTLVYIRGDTLVRATITALGERRGPAPEARALYTVTDAPAQGQGKDTHARRDQEAILPDLEPNPADGRPKRRNRRGRPDGAGGAGRRGVF